MEGDVSVVVSVELPATVGSDTGAVVGVEAVVGTQLTFLSAHVVLAHVPSTSRSSQLINPPSSRSSEYKKY